MKFDFAREREATRIAKAFEKFVECSATRYMKDFYTRFGLHGSTFDAYMKWADKNLRGFNSRALKARLRERWK